MDGAHNQDFRTIPGLLPSVKGGRSLDLGCGSGLYTQELARQGSKPVGIDRVFGYLGEARRNVGDGRISWVRAEATHLPFRAGVFDFVISTEVLTHLSPESRNKAIGEIARVICVNGLVLMTLHNRARLNVARWVRLQRPKESYVIPPIMVWPTTAEEVRGIAPCCGLEEVGKVRYLNYHSRFTRRFYTNNPRSASLVILVEDLLSRIPLVRRLAIVFLVSFRKVDCK